MRVSAKRAIVTSHVETKETTTTREELIIKNKYNDKCTGVTDWNTKFILNL